MPHIDPEMLLSFILLLIIASFTAYYANQKGRNPTIWFIIGLLLGIFAPLILLFFRDLTNQKQNPDLPTMTVLPPDPDHSSPSPILPPIVESKEEDKLWYYLDQDHQQIGPVSVVALRELWKRGLLELDSYVWTDGMSQWQKVDQLVELKEVLNKG